jgi:hypothetical protein
MQYKALVENTKLLGMRSPHTITRKASSMQEFMSILKKRGLSIKNGMIAEDERFDWIVEASDGAQKHWRYHTVQSAKIAEAQPFNSNQDYKQYKEWRESRMVGGISPCLKQERPSEEYMSSPMRPISITGLGATQILI